MIHAAREEDAHPHGWWMSLCGHLVRERECSNKMNKVTCSTCFSIAVSRFLGGEEPPMKQDPPEPHYYPDDAFYRDGITERPDVGRGQSLRYNGPSVDDDGTKDHDEMVVPGDPHDVNERMDDVHHKLDKAMRDLIRFNNQVLSPNGRDTRPYDDRILGPEYRRRLRDVLVMASHAWMSSL